MRCEDSNESARKKVYCTGTEVLVCSMVALAIVRSDQVGDMVPVKLNESGNEYDIDVYDVCEVPVKGRRINKGGYRLVVDVEIQDGRGIITRCDAYTKRGNRIPR
jgi:hypothetical protein